MRILIRFFCIGDNGSWESQEIFILQWTQFKNGTSSGSAPAKSRYLNLAPPVILKCQKEDQWNQQTLPGVKDSEKIASAQFRIGAWILGKQRKRLVCIIPTGVHRCPLKSSKLENSEVFFPSVTLSCRNCWPNSRQHWVWMPFLLPEIRRWEEIWPEFTCLRVLGNHFGNPETSKIQTNLWRLDRTPVIYVNKAVDSVEVSWTYIAF